jgi:hypothetical protein
VGESLDSLVTAGRLRREPTSPQEIARFLATADTSLADSALAGLSPAGRFKHAYDAAHALALCALRAHGLRPASVPGHRAIVFQALAMTLGAERTLWSTLERYHTRGNKSEYEGMSTVSDAEARELTTLARTLRDRLVQWLTANRPALLR